MPVSVNIKGRLTSQQLPPEAGRIKPVSKPEPVKAEAKIEETAPPTQKKLFSLRKPKRARP